MDNNIHSVDNLYCDNIPSLNLMSNKMIETDIETLKQALIREEQKNTAFITENKELISEVLTKNNQLTILGKTIKELKQKNEELKQKLKTLQIQDDENIVYEVSEYEFNRANKYEQTLKEIRKIVTTQWYFKETQEELENIINEVLGDAKHTKNPCDTCDVEPPVMKFKCPECEYGGNNVRYNS